MLPRLTFVPRIHVGHCAAYLVCALATSAALAAISPSGSISPTATNPGADPIVGIDDIGRLLISAGDALTSDAVIIGDQLKGIGLVTITDFVANTASPSTWTTTSIVVGRLGTGRLEVLNGGVVNIDYAAAPGAGDLIIGDMGDALGTVIVNGLGSMLRVGDDTSIGGVDGAGIMRIENNGLVVATNDAATGIDQFTVGLRGRLELDNGRLRSETLANNGVIVGSGRIDNEAIITNAATGIIQTVAGKQMFINSVVDNKGEIAAHGGAIEFLEPVTSTAATAKITLRDSGTTRFQESGFGYDSSSGTLASTAGVNDVYGTVRLQGVNSKIVVAGESTAVFHDHVTNSGGIVDVFPGSSVVYLGGLTTSGSGASLSMHLTDPGGELDLGQVEVNGTAALAGNVSITLENAYTPSIGDTFQLLSAGNVTGMLALQDPPPLSSRMAWDLDVNTTNVLLSVVGTGDYNANGVVDGADFVLWRKMQGAMGDDLAADGNGDRKVDAGDYNFWRARFGNVIPTALASAAAAQQVPEPHSAMLLVIGAIGAFGRRRR